MLVYKVERYLPRCLDSIVAQTFTDWECILIDDGSPDNSGAICDEYAKQDSQFVVIHQENAGVSATRNAGLDAARGNGLPLWTAMTGWSWNSCKDNIMILFQVTMMYVFVGYMAEEKFAMLY